ncbi:MAG: complex I NDUFA9 subunit family protein [Hyphomicrobiaceae bacterium]
MASRPGEARLVTVFGGSGFLGRHVVRALARRGYRIRAAERRPDLAGHLQPMGGVGQIQAVQANLRNLESIRRAVAGADAVVNLVGILAETGRQRFDNIHVEGARRVARAGREAGIASLVHVSAIGADARSNARYARSKANGEKAVLEELPGAVIMRPSLVFGPEDQLFNRFAGLAAMSPVMPVIGGRSRFQPVYAGDVAEAIANALDGRARPGTVYELGGPEVVTMRQIIERTLAYTGRKRRLAPVPFWFAKLKAIGFKMLPSSLRPFTLDQMRMLQKDNLVGEAATAEARSLAGLGVTAPVSMEMVVPDYLVRFRDHGQYATYRG